MCVRVKSSGDDDDEDDDDDGYGTYNVYQLFQH